MNVRGAHGSWPVAACHSTLASPPPIVSLTTTWYHDGPHVCDYFCDYVCYGPAPRCSPRPGFARIHPPCSVIQVPLAFFPLSLVHFRLATSH